jgi:hypothetical protein
VTELEHPTRGRLGLNAAGLATVVNVTDEHGDVTYPDTVVYVGAYVD